MNWTQTFALLLALAAYSIWPVMLTRERLAAPEFRSLPPLELFRRLGLSVLLLPILVAFVGFHGLSGLLFTVAAAGFALAVWTFVPRQIGSKVLPLSLIAAGLYGFLRLRGYLVHPAEFRYGFVNTSVYGTFSQLLLYQAFAFLAAGMWLASREIRAGSRITDLVLFERGPVRGQRGRPRWGLLLLVVVGLIVELLGRSFWLNTYWWNASETMAVVAVAVLLVIKAPKISGNLALAGLILFGLYGIALGVFWPVHVPLPSLYTDTVRYGVFYVNSRGSAIGAGAEGLALTALGLWLVPRAIDDRTRALFRSASDADLARRVTRLTRSRADAVDSATVQLRRLERDLHDGAQARLVALGMSLTVAERLIPTSPQAAAELVAEARENSIKVLDELRHLVRGICPPVLADRGLADAIRALALDTPLRTDVEVDLPSRTDLAVETACYFAVAEALTNAVKHAGARHVQIKIWCADGSLRITVIDDGCGGADPAAGSGLRGLERRLGQFDGVLAVNSPVGGPTIIAIEVPCTLTAPKASSISQTV